MRVLMLSKACIVGSYQKKLEELARFPDVELTVVVPPYWRDERGVMSLERTHVRGYELVVEPMLFNGSFHLHFYPGLGRIVRRVRPEVMHIDEEPWDTVTFHAMRQAVRVGARACFFTWQNMHRRYPPPFTWFQRYVFRHAGHAIAGNREAVGVLRRKGYTSPITVIPQFGVDPDIYRPASRPGKASPSKATPRAPFTIGFVGRLIEAKGVDVLLRAVAGLEGAWQVRILGSGPWQARLAALAGELGIAGRVTFDVPIPSAEMPAHYRRLSVLVLPSLTRSNWKEQFGRVLIEAMACGVPVIGSRSGEIPHVIGDAGLTFPEGDAGALRAALARLMSDETLYAALAAKGRERVLARYTQAQIAAQTYEVYRALLDTQTPA